MRSPASGPNDADPIHRGSQPIPSADDVSYFDEPFFQDGIIGEGVDDAQRAACRISHPRRTISAPTGTNPTLRWVANGTGNTAGAGNTALAGTNIDLTTVPAELYAGGFHNFNPNPGQIDVAQTVNIAANNTVPTVLAVERSVRSGHRGRIGRRRSIPTPAPVNTRVFDETVTFSRYSAIDAGHVVSARRQRGRGGDCRRHRSRSRIRAATISCYAGQHGRMKRCASSRRHRSGYKVIGRPFRDDDGAIPLHDPSGDGFSTGQTIYRLNLLVFTAAGAYRAGQFADRRITSPPTNPWKWATSIAAAVRRCNTSSPAPTFRPVAVPRTSVICCPATVAANYGPQEYFSYNTVTTGGHAMAQGTNGMAAYSVFRPSLPETFSSPGPVTHLLRR